ncbi:MAG: ABC transporter substrate binding protein [Motiliproteus sp.]
MLSRSILLSLSLILFLAKEPPVDLPADGPQPLSAGILMVLWRGETEAEHGFREGLNELGFNSPVTIIDARQDRNRLAGLLRLQTHQLSQFDAVYTFGTTASVMTQQVLRNRRPQIFNMVSDPVGAGLVDGLSRNQNSPSGKSITGISDAISASLRLTTAATMFPIKRLAVLINPREENSMSQLQELRKASTDQGIDLIELRGVPELRYWTIY